MVIIGQGLGTIQILADALPKIVPYVLINHREVCFLAIFLMYHLSQEFSYQILSL